MGPRRECPNVVRRPIRTRPRSGLTAGALAVGFGVAVTFGAFAGAPVPARAADSLVPRVVIIVGPAGAATDGYRAQARDAAAVARRYTTDVTELYSPNATWPAVRDALQGASVVIYMGHGNGWPSRYRDSLYPPTQNGFGLNPKAGGNDSEHQYFGEAAVGSQVRLAADAVVLLNHLCYASGNSEPGLVEGDLDTAKLRVDNFAAGFIKAGASAVIADAYASPTAYLASILGGRASIDSIWRHAASINGHAFAFESRRSPGFVAQMDPEHAASGFTRSIVLRAGLTPANVRAGARSGGGSGPRPSTPSLASTGIRFASSDIASVPSAGAVVRLDLPFKIANRAALPKGIEASVRWDVLELRTPAVDPPKPGPAASTSPVPVAPVPDFPAEIAPLPIAPLAPPDSLDLVVPERPGDVVAPSPLASGKSGFTLPVTVPAAPGRYRLIVTLHDADGVAFDSATQAMLPNLDVRVTGDQDGAILAAPTMTLTAGSAVELPIRVANLGMKAWGKAAVLDPTGGTTGRPATAATIAGWWLPPGTLVDVTTLPPAIEPGAIVDALVKLTVPRTPGTYVLVLDIVMPNGRSLMADGVDPTLVRITVVEPR